MTIFDTNHNNMQMWIDEIKKINGESDDINVIQFALSFTLQSLRNCEEDVQNKFKWK